MAVRADVADPADGERMVDAAEDNFGALNGAVNCAGISSQLSVPMAQTPLETWRAVMAVNLDGVFYSITPCERSCRRSRRPGAARS